MYKELHVRLGRKRGGREEERNREKDLGGGGGVMGATYGQGSLINSFGSLLGIEIKKIMRLFFSCLVCGLLEIKKKIMRYMGSQ